MVFVMRACIVLHNMIVENRREEYESGMCGLAFMEEGISMFHEGKKFT